MHTKKAVILCGRQCTML